MFPTHRGRVGKEPIDVRELIPRTLSALIQVLTTTGIPEGACLELEQGVQREERSRPRSSECQMVPKMFPHVETKVCSAIRGPCFINRVGLVCDCVCNSGMINDSPSIRVPLVNSRRVELIVDIGTREVAHGKGTTSFKRSIFSAQMRCQLEAKRRKTRRQHTWKVKESKMETK